MRPRDGRRDALSTLAGTCDWRAGATPDTGECYLSAQWMTKELQGCSAATARRRTRWSGAPGRELNCLDKSTDEGACDGMGGRCQWTDSLAQEGVPSFCGPNLHAAQALVGLDGLAKISPR